MATFSTEETAEAAYIMHRHFEETGQVMECKIFDNGAGNPMTIVLGNGAENNAGAYAMEWPKSKEFAYHANLDWLKLKIKKMRGLK